MKSQKKTRGAMRPSGTFGFVVPGSRKRSPEYPCVSRFRQRRLLTFLLHHKFNSAYKALLGDTDVFMCLPHLLCLVEEGLWNEAIEYLARFLPSDRLLGLQGRVLFHFLRLHKAIADIVAGAEEGLPVAAALDQCFVRYGTKSHALTKLRAIFSSLLHSSRLRASLDLVRLRDKAALIILDLVYQIPELKDHMKGATRGTMNPQDVLPLGFGQASFRPRRHVKKPGRVPAPVVAGLYLQKKKMLPSSTTSHSQGLTRESLIKAKEWLVDLVDSSLEAGKLHQGYVACNKGPSVASALQTNLGTLTRRARIPVLTHHVLLRMAKEWMFYLTEECLEAWPDLRQGYPPKFVCQNVPGYLLRLQTAELVAEAVPGAPFSQTKCGTLTDAAEISGITSVTNADALLSQTLSVILTDPAKNSVISSVINSGTYTHLSQEGCYTESAHQGFGSTMELTTVGQGCDPEGGYLASLVETKVEDRLVA